MKAVPIRDNQKELEQLLDDVAEAIAGDPLQVVVIVKRRDKTLTYAMLHGFDWTMDTVGMLEWMKLNIFQDHADYQDRHGSS